MYNKFIPQKIETTSETKYYKQTHVSILATTCLESPPNRSTPTIASEGNFHSFNSFQPVLHLSNIPPITNITSFDSPPFLSPSGEYDYFNEFTVFILYLFETKHCVHLNPQVVLHCRSSRPPVPFRPHWSGLWFHLGRRMSLVSQM